MAKKPWWEKLLGAAEVGKMATTIGKSMDKTLKDAEKKIEKATTNAIKAAMTFILAFIGLIFLLVGVAAYITEMWTLKPGVGLIMVGGALLLLGWFAKLVRPN